MLRRPGPVGVREFVRHRWGKSQWPVAGEGRADDTLSQRNTYVDISDWVSARWAHTRQVIKEQGRCLLDFGLITKRGEGEVR